MQLHCDWPLHRCHYGLLIRRGFVSHRVTKALFRHPDKSIRVRYELGSFWMRGSAIKNICNCFTLVRR